ncbi:hypothetical protein HAX54_013175 [Datura stramonium]|uniref:Uncharacterized protein n=1 Tax=Datura stramonium TaxID=4076 RepID=A0ABS8TMF6_DATST|nr:hypothetical protein [Datura stramonium]
MNDQENEAAAVILRPEQTLEPGGWRVMPFVIGQDGLNPKSIFTWNETFERLALGLLANFTQFSLTVFHMDLVGASDVCNIWSGVTSFIPLLGAFISDAYIGRLWTIVFASVFQMMGMLTLTLIPWLPQVHPPPCKVGQQIIAGFSSNEPRIFVHWIGWNKALDSDLYNYSCGVYSRFRELGNWTWHPYDERESNGSFYDPPLQVSIVKKLPLTNKYRFLNKASIVMVLVQIIGDYVVSNKLKKQNACLGNGDYLFHSHGTTGHIYIFSSSKLGPKFKIPAGTIIVILMITVGIWLPIYDRFMVPYMRKITRIEGGITLLQRIGIGIVFSIFSMVLAGPIEKMRRNSAIKNNSPDGTAPITVVCKEPPENMSSVANSLFSCTGAGANYLSLILVNILRKTTGGRGHPDWLTDDINAGRFENFYYVIAALGVLNLFYFLYVARRYHYKTRLVVDDEIKAYSDVHELHDIKYYATCA